MTLVWNDGAFWTPCESELADTCDMRPWGIVHDSGQLSVRAENLMREHFPQMTWQQLSEIDPRALFSLRGLGHKTRAELSKCLEMVGLRFAYQHDRREPSDAPG